MGFASLRSVNLRLVVSQSDAKLNRSRLGVHEIQSSCPYGVFLLLLITAVTLFFIMYLLAT